jgi:hypothetical protein
MPDSSFTEMMAMSSMIAESGMFAPKGEKALSAPQVAMRLMTGRALGIPAMIAMQHIYDLYGRTGLSAKLKMALVLRHPDCVLFEHVMSDNTKAVYRIQRRGKDVKTFEFTMADATRAELVKPSSNYAKYPRRMFEARASSEAADVVFPDATMGMPTVEELEESDLQPGEIRGEVVPPTVPARDWAKEAEAIKAQLTAAVSTGDRAAGKDARAKMKAFEGEAPPYIVESLVSFYNGLRAEVKPGAAQPQTTATKPAATSTTRDAYLPPNQRGEHYNGPETPETPFG